MAGFLAWPSPVYIHHVVIIITLLINIRAAEVKVPSNHAITSPGECLVYCASDGTETSNAPGGMSER